MGDYPLRITKQLLLTLLALLLAGLACSQVSLPNPFATRTPTPFVQCTPPPCATDETYACGAGPGNCPGGCGTICVKKTAEPSAATDTPTPASAGDAGCTIVVRTPVPEAPTASVGGTPQSDRQVDPHVELCAGNRSVRAGNPVVVLAQAVDIGLPIYQVMVRDAGAADFVPLVQVSYDNQVKILEGHSQVLAYHAVQVQGNQMVVELLAVAPGTAEIAISATGEVHYGYPGPATWAGGGSEPLAITVTQ